MVDQIMIHLINMVVDLFELTDVIFSSFDGWIYVIAAFTIYTIFRFLLFPLMGGRTIQMGSDIVKSPDDVATGLEKPKRKKGN